MTYQPTDDFSQSSLGHETDAKKRAWVTKNENYPGVNLHGPQSLRSTSADDCTVLVSNIPKNVNSTTLKYFFESHRGGNGPVTKCDVDFEKGQGYLTFTEPKFAENVLNKEIVLAGTKLRVERLQSLTEAQEGIIVVSGFAPGTPELAIQFFLESFRCEGGTISNLKYDDSKQQATVTYEDPQVAERVASKGTLDFDGTKLSVSLRTDEDAKTIKVSGFKKSTKPNLIRLCFESARTQGGETTAFEFNPRTGVALITYKDPIVAEKVLAMGKYTLDGAELIISRNIVDERTICAVNFAPDTDKLTLELFFENPQYGGGPYSKLDYDEKKRRAFITFIDAKVAKSLLQKRKIAFSDTEISIITPEEATAGEEEEEEAAQEASRIRRLPMVKVLGLKKDTHKDTIMYFFEAKGGTVKHVEFDSSNGEAIVTFESIDIAERVLDNKEYELDEAKLTVTRVLASQSQNEGIITVSGFPTDAQELIIQCFLENPNFGGPCKYFQYDAQRRLAKVTFEKATDGEKLLKNKRLELDGSYLAVSRYQMSKADEAMLVINGVSESTSESSVRAYFESWRINGGPTSHVRLDKQKGKAYVTYEDASYARAVLCYPELKLEGSCLRASMGEEQDRVVVLVDIAANTKQTDLRLFLESPRNDGGTVQNIVMDTAANRAVVTFEEIQVAQRMLKKGSITIHQSNVQILPYYRYGSMEEGEGVEEEVDFVEEEKGEYAMEVRGIGKSVTEELLGMFFSSMKRSGGGAIQDVWHDEARDFYVITYESPDVVRRVDQMCKRRNLELDGNPLSVVAIKPDYKHPSVPMGAIDAQKLIIRNIPDGIPPEKLEDLMGKHAKAKVTQITYGLEPDVAMVHFAKKPDFKSAWCWCQRNPIRGQFLQVCKVAAPTAVQVHNIGDVNETHLSLYFESPGRSGGGDTSEFIFKKEEGCAIIKFVELEAFKKVLDPKRTHRLDNSQVHVDVYYEELGIVPPNHDTTRPPINIPNDTSIQVSSELTLRFLRDSATIKQLLQNQLKEIHGEVDWVKSQGDTLHVQCTMNRSTRGVQQLAKIWTKKCDNLVKKHLADILDVQIKLLHGVWGPMMEELKCQPKPDPKECLIDINEAECCINLVGMKEQVESCAMSYNFLHQDIVAEMERQKTQTEETMKTLKWYQIQLLLQQGFVQAAETKFKNLQAIIDDVNNVITFKGQPGVIMSAKLLALERASMLVAENLPMKKLALKLLKTRECLDYLEKNIREKNVQQESVWRIEPQHDEVTIAAFDRETLKKLKDIFLEEVICTAYDVKGEALNIFDSDIWQTFREEKLREHQGLALMEFDGTMLSIAGISTAAHSISEQYQNFLDKNVVLEETLTMDIPMGYVDLEKTREIENSLKKFKVKIEPTRDGTGFIIKGTRFGMEPAQQQLKEKFGGQGAAAMPDIAQPICEETVNGRKMKVVKADLTEYKVDAIVNAANQDMNHGGGLALAIVRKGGQCIQDECKRHVATEGKVLVGRCMISGAGNLPCKMVFHAVGPMWEGGYAGEENNLFDTIIEVMEKASAKGVKTIALPAICTGVFKFPVKLATQHIVQAVKEFLSTSYDTSIQEVHFVDVTRETVIAFQKALNSS